MVTVRPVNIKEANEQTKIDVGRFLTPLFIFSFMLTDKA